MSTLPIYPIIRETHTRTELAAIRGAVVRTDRVFGVLKQWIKIGMSEQMVVRKISALFKEYDASALSFPPIVAFGSNAANPHHEPTARRLRKNEMVKLDFGCVYKNKCSDMTRTLFFGSPDARFKKLYALVLRAQERTIAKIRSGVSCGAIDRAARGTIERAGFGKNFLHGTGHGISEFVHELPLLRPKATDRLTAGQVVTVEPGIYIKGWGGIRIEDMILVKNGGYEVLTKSEKRPALWFLQ
ncbi:aminopeptidase P family protein [Candidatus Uhrbacteria bacterium]|nr:aminopeptidase P family protein [Candidatus Uhrbacteria bacterium]